MYIFNKYYLYFNKEIPHKKIYLFDTVVSSIFIEYQFLWISWGFIEETLIHTNIDEHFLKNKYMYNVLYTILCMYIQRTINLEYYCNNDPLLYWGKTTEERRFIKIFALNTGILWTQVLALSDSLRYKILQYSRTWINNLDILIQFTY